MASGLVCGLLLLLQRQRHLQVAGLVAGLGMQAFARTLSQSPASSIGAILSVVIICLLCGRTALRKIPVRKKRLRTLKDLDRTALLLARACTLLLDENTDEAALRQAIFRRIPKEKLAE